LIFAAALYAAYASPLCHQHFFPACYAAYAFDIFGAQASQAVAPGAPTSPILLFFFK
jgi:hypothetical protein